MRFPAPIALSLAIAAALGLASPVRAAADNDAHALVERALKAMGQQHDLHQAASLRTDTINASWDIVEFDHADAPYVFQGASSATQIDDLRGGRRLTDESQIGAGAAPASLHTRILRTPTEERTDLVFNGHPPRTTRLDAAPAWNMDEPIAVLLAAVKAQDLVRDADASPHGIPQHVVSFQAGGYPVRVFIDAVTDLPSAIESTRVLRRATGEDIAYNALGDIQDRTDFMNYAVFGGVRYPVQSDLYRNGVLLRTSVRADVQVEDALDAKAFDMPPSEVALSHVTVDDLALGQPVGFAPNPHAPISEIAAGIVQVPGSWFSTIVRQDDGLVIIDAPISDAYSRKVLDEASRRFPHVPVKALVTSTAFYWHVAGVREYVARGIPIYVRDRNEATIRKILSAPHTLVPDTLALHPKTPDIRPVSTATAIGRGHNAIVLYPISQGEQPMEMTWIADARLLHTGEMLMPLGPNGALVQPEALFEAERSIEATPIPTKGLRMIGMHMRPTDWAVLVKAVSDAGL
ncbi:hypothetical protein ACQKIE_12990 [Luteibacter sp. NPDC031894]|uniref:hypothetical protein n=1 Tax=Luteibacter sp. NPDC031894 TaxID=3390572 RepID=UPI003D05D7DA